MGQSALPNFNSFEILQVGATSISSPGATVNYISVAHNLGYVPVPLVFMNNVFFSGITGTGNVPLPMYTSANIDTTNHVVNFRSWMFGVADSDNFYIILLNSTGSSISSFPIKYFLLREKAN